MAPLPPPGAHDQSLNRVPYLPGLDGLRALAVVAVMLYHADKTWLRGGFLGVEVFFVISGYLITLLLIGEQQQTGRVNLKQFWLRRFRRLLPALIVMMALLAVYVAVFYRRAQGQVRGDMIGGMSYLSNWYQIFVGAGYTAQEAFAPLRHLWSLAVEEQFYLVWPVVMAVILRRGHQRLPRVALWLVGVAVAIAAVTAVLFVSGDVNSTCTADSGRGYWRLFGRCISINDTLYLSTVTRAGGLMLGSAFAMVWRPHALMRGPIRDKGRQLDVIALFGLGFLGLLMWTTHLAEPAKALLTGSRFDALLFRGGLFATGVASLLIIAAVTHPRAVVGRLLGNRLFVWIGTRSYGLYLYHWPIYQVIRKEAGFALSTTQFVVAMLITVPITEASYRLVERPIRSGRVGAWWQGVRRPRSRKIAIARRRLAAAGLGGVTLLSFASVSIAISPVRCLGDVECASQEGLEAIAENQPFDITSGALGTASPPSASTADSVTEASSTTGKSAPASTSVTVSTTPEEIPKALPTTSPPTTIANAPAEATVTTAAAVTPAESPDPAGTQPPTPITDPPPAAPAPTAAAPPVDPATTVPVVPDPNRDQLPTIALGESVMLGAAPQLTAGGILTDAEVGRGPDKTGDILQWLRDNNRIGRVMVLQVGTNGPVSQAQYDRLMSYLPAGEVTVVFLTVKAPKSWIAGNNALIRALPQQYPNVRIVDWEAEAAAIEGELSRSDGGVHLRTTYAKQFYANLVFNGIGRPDLVQ
jgi:peptidoglycan/LPS O-acetylase OafA/YrhL